MRFTRRRGGRFRTVRHEQYIAEVRLLHERLAKLEAIIKRQGKLDRPTAIFEREAEQIRSQLAVRESEVK